MPDPRLDVLCIGNAIVDVIANASDEFLKGEGLVKASMRLIDADEAERLYSHMGPAHQVSGGSAGNTAAGVAALGGRAGFIGQVGPDQLGEFYRHDLTSAGVEFITPAADVGAPTAQHWNICLTILTCSPPSPCISTITRCTFVCATIVGWLKDTTGSFEAGLLAMAGFLAVSTVVALLLKFVIRDE